MQKQNVPPMGGCEIGGSGHENSQQAAMRTLLPSAVPGQGPRCSDEPNAWNILKLVAANGISSHVFDFDGQPTHTPRLILLPGWTRPSWLWPSTAESGATYKSMVVGIEDGVPIGKAVTPSHSEDGWHLTVHRCIWERSLAAGRRSNDEQQMCCGTCASGCQPVVLQEMFRVNDKKLPTRQSSAKWTDRKLSWRARGSRSSDAAAWAKRGWFPLFFFM